MVRAAGELTVHGIAEMLAADPVARVPREPRDLVYIMYTSGATGPGTVDLTLNFLPGFVVGWVLGWSFAAAFLLGGVTYISSSGIAAKLMRDLGWLGNREAPAVLSVLVIEDLVMAIHLAVAAALILGASVGGAAWSILGSAAIVVVMLVAAGRFGSRVSLAPPSHHLS